MTDTNTPPPPTAPVPPAPPVPPARSRWLKPALVVSLALNLAFLGAIGGAALHGPPGGTRTMVRDLGFGPFTEALSPQDREALARAFIDRGGSQRDMRRDLRGDFSALLAALRAEPFDPDALREVFAQIDARGRERLLLGQQLLSDRIVAMSPQDRAMFADRLEDRLTRRPIRDGMMDGGAMHGGDGDKSD